MQFWAPSPAAAAPQRQRPPARAPGQQQQQRRRQQLANLQRELSDELAGHDHRQAAIRSQFAVEGLTEDEQLQLALAQSAADGPTTAAAEAGDDTSSDAALAQALHDEINRR